MIGAKKFALLIDIDNVPVDAGMLQKVLGQVEVLGEVAYAKFYGYSDRKHRDLEDVINANAYDTAQRMRMKKRNKSQLDVRLVIDAMRIACTNPSIDAFCIVGGDGDFVPLITALKSMGKFVLGGFLGDGENAGACHQDLDIQPAAVAIPNVAAIKLPKVEKPKPDPNMEQELADLSKLDFSDVIAKQGQPANPEDDLQSMFREIERVVNDFKQINKD